MWGRELLLLTESSEWQGVQCFVGSETCGPFQNSAVKCQEHGSQPDYGEKSSAIWGNERWRQQQRGGRLFLLLLFYFKAPDDSFRCQVFTLGGHSEIISMLVSLTMKSKMAICSTVRKMIDAQL